MSIEIMDWLQYYLTLNGDSRDASGPKKGEASFLGVQHDNIIYWGWLSGKAENMKTTLL